MKTKLLFMTLFGLMFANAQTASVYFTHPEYASPEGIAIDKNEIIYISSYNNAHGSFLLRLDGDGTAPIFYNYVYNVDHVTDFTFAPGRIKDDDVCNYNDTITSSGINSSNDDSAIAIFLKCDDGGANGYNTVMYRTIFQTAYGIEYHKHQDGYYYSNQATGDIVYFDANTPDIETVYATGFSNPKAIALNSLGDLYVANNGDEQLIKVNVNTGVREVLASNIKNINGVALSSSNDVYFTSYDNSIDEHKILKYDYNTGLVSDYVVNGFLNEPKNIVIDSLDNLYVTCAGNKSVIKITDDLLSNPDIDKNIENLVLYPTLTDNLVTISSTTNLYPLEINIYNVNGKLLKNKTLTTKDTIDFSPFSSGLYFVEIETSKGSITKRVIKK